MSEIEGQPLHPAAKKFLEVLFKDFIVEGISRRVEFIDDGDGNTTVKLIAPNDVLPSICLGMSNEWFPPGDEEWNESLEDEYPSVEEFLGWMTDPNRPAFKSEALKAEEARDTLTPEEYEHALAHENELSPVELDAECSVIHPGKPHEGPHSPRGIYALRPGETEQEREARLRKLQPWRWVRKDNSDD